MFSKYPYKMMTSSFPSCAAVQLGRFIFRWISVVGYGLLVPGLSGMLGSTNQFLFSMWMTLAWTADDPPTPAPHDPPPPTPAADDPPPPTPGAGTDDPPYPRPKEDSPVAVGGGIEWNFSMASKKNRRSKFEI